MGNSPNFLIIGERRSGTTTLAHWIKEHPQIFLHPTMDMGYFVDDELVGSREYKTGKADYEAWSSSHSKSDYESRFAAANGQALIGEKSADYLFLSQCHQRIKSFFPDIKLLVMLRNPIDRAWSMYWNEVGKGREELPFEAALAAESKRIQESDYAKDHLSYFSRGLYADSLQQLYRVFSPEQVCVTILEEARQDPQKALTKVYQFLGVDPALGMEAAGKTFNRNWTVEPKAFVRNSRFWGLIDRVYFQLLCKAVRLLSTNTYRRRRLIVRWSSPFREKKASRQMHPVTKAELAARYAAPKAALERLLGQKIGWW